MSFDTAAGTAAPATLPLQFVHIEIAPLIDGQYSVVMQATLLDEVELQFVGEDITHEQVDTLDQAIAVIRQNVAILNAAARL